MRKSISIALLIFSLNCIAGGSHVTVNLLQFTTYDKGYVLIVSPTGDRDDPYMKGCKIFTVLGSYDPKSIVERIKIAGRLPNQRDHIQAIEYLKTKPEKLNLGWAGTGFKQLNPNEACVVKSRALELFESPEHGTTVVSNYKGI